MCPPILGYKNVQEYKMLLVLPTGNKKIYLFENHGKLLGEINYRTRIFNSFTTCI